MPISTVGMLSLFMKTSKTVEFCNAKVGDTYIGIEPNGKTNKETCRGRVVKVGLKNSYAFPVDIQVRLQSHIHPKHKLGVEQVSPFDGFLIPPSKEIPKSLKKHLSRYPHLLVARRVCNGDEWTYQLVSKISWTTVQVVETTVETATLGMRFDPEVDAVEWFQGRPSVDGGNTLFLAADEEGEMDREFELPKEAELDRYS